MTKLVRWLPRSGTMWGRLGTAFYTHHFNAPAELAFAQAERFSPRDPRWPYLRGLSMAEENIDAALPMLRRAAALADDSTPAPHLRFAELLIERGELDEAASQLTRLLAHDPENARALLDVGRLELARDRLPESRAHLERSIAQAPEIKATHMLLATVLQRIGEKDGSAKESEVASARPEKAFWPHRYRQEALAFWVGKDAILSRGDDAFAQRNPALARDLFQQAAHDYPQDARTWTGLASAQRALGDAAAAEAALDKALALDPDSVPAHIELGGVFYSGQKYTEAEREFREAIRLRPELPEAWANLGLTLTAKGDPAQASGVFQKALALKPAFPEACTYLGQALAMTGQLTAAAEMLDRALALNPRDPKAQTLREKVRTALQSKSAP